MASISLMKIAEKMKLENLTPEINLKGIKVTLPDINRPALPMAGYFEHFEATRLQVIGFVEYSYVKRMSEKEEKEMLEKLLDYPIPGIIFCRELHPDELFRQIAIEKGVPLLMTKRATSSFTAELIRWLNVKLAPCISVHGVLVDVYGEGVLITGESGIGKSEAALELIKRGHRLVTDDVVEIRKDDELVKWYDREDHTGRNCTGYHKTLYRAARYWYCGRQGAVRCFECPRDTEYRPRNPSGRVGQGQRIRPSRTGRGIYGISGQQDCLHNIPIRPGRNLAIICEAAAVNHRQKKMGYNAAQELYRRVQENLTKKSSDDDE